MMDGLMQMMQDNDWAIAQDQDPTLAWLKSKVRNGTIGSARVPSQCLQAHPYLHHWHQFHVKFNILYRAQKSLEQKKEWLQLVLLEPFYHTALQYCHDQLGHHGVNHTLALLCDWFYWPQMDTDVRQHISISTLHSFQSRWRQLLSLISLLIILLSSFLTFSSWNHQLNSKKMYWSSLITSRNMHKHTQQEIKLLLWLHKFCGKVLSFIMGSLTKSLVTKAEILSHLL